MLPCLNRNHVGDPIQPDRVSLGNSVWHSHHVTRGESTIAGCQGFAPGSSICWLSSREAIVVRAYLCVCERQRERVNVPRQANSVGWVRAPVVRMHFVVLPYQLTSYLPQSTDYYTICVLWTGVPIWYITGTKVKWKYELSYL